MRVKIDKDEWWPYYILSRSLTGYGKECEIPEALVLRWEAVDREIVEVMDLLKPYEQGPTREAAHE